MKVKYIKKAQYFDNSKIKLGNVYEATLNINGNYDLIDDEGGITSCYPYEVHVIAKRQRPCLPSASCSAIEPPLGLIPNKFHKEKINAERFSEVCAAIARYFNDGLKINIEWIEEYNDLVERV